MKPVFITFTDDKGKKTKTYTTCTLKTGLMDSIFEIAERAQAMDAGNVDIAEVRAFYRDLKAIIVKAFGNEFTMDELNEGIENDALMKAFQELCANAMGGIQKN